MDIARETALAYRSFADGEYAQARDRARRVLEHAPDDPGALTLVGRLALLSSEPDVAHEIFNGIVASYPESAATWLDLAAALRDLARHEDALQAVQRALDLEARNPMAWTMLGELRLTLDEREQASAAFREALALAPENAAAYRGLSLAEELDPGSDIVDRMTALVGSSRLHVGDAAKIHYALAQLHRHSGRDAEFVEHLLAANAKQRTLSPQGRAEYAATYDRLESAYTAEAFAKAARAADVQPTPIFILGMPRSGTTLVERLVAAHPDVTAAGEVNYVRGPLCRTLEARTGRRFPEAFETVGAGHVNEMARAYARRLALVGNGKRYVTDKTPDNFHALGLLRTLFRRGKIIHVVRDPMDTCFSILQHPFHDRAAHTCDMELLAYAYARYVRLMERWSEIFGDEFISIEYERLVESPETEAPRIFAYCGLEWSPAYLEFHRDRSAVRTFSTTQVRRPIYTTSVGAWRKYSQALAPLERALAAELGLCARRPFARMLKTSSPTP